MKMSDYNVTRTGILDLERVLELTGGDNGGNEAAGAEAGVLGEVNCTRGVSSSLSWLVGLPLNVRWRQKTLRRLA